jgi:general secretion pathway protein C
MIGPVRAYPVRSTGADGAAGKGATFDGVLVFDIRPQSVLRILGIRNGDVIRSVNGLTITDPKSALTAYQQLRKADTVTVELERVGQPVKIEYRVR